MPVNVELTFSADSQSASDFLSVNGQGCYIPAYQREYSWDKGNVDRLLEDARNGLHQIPTKPNIISFLGTIIAIHDTKHTTIQPAFKDSRSLPTKVMTIIDGQQRLATFILIFIAIHSYMSRNITKIAKRPKNDVDQLLVDEITEILAQLRKAYVCDKERGEAPFRYYPTMIRSYDDVWSPQSEHAKYDGSIAKLIWQYINHSEENPGKVFRPAKSDPSDLTEGRKDSGSYETVRSVYSHISGRLTKIFKGTVEDEFHIELVELISNDEFADALLGFAVSQEVKDRLSAKPEERDQLYFELFAALILARYLQWRMAFTVVEATTEDDAFDMFEALNTTGEPLTAIETFKPRVTEAEGLAAFQSSESAKELARTEAYLNRFKKAEAKQSAASQLLVPFALAETGEKIGKKLAEQRRYLRRQYDDAAPSDDTRMDFKRQFVRRLGDISEFVATTWEPEVGNPTFGRLSVSSDQALTSFEYLRELNHTVTIAPLTRFYSGALHADEKSREIRVSDLENAIQASAAFSAIWRSAFGGTNNIDRRYRDLMKEGVDSVALSARPSKKGVTSETSLTNYKLGLRQALAEVDIGTKDQWIEAASKVPLYDKSKQTCRFLLIVASHDAVPDPAEAGLIVAGRQGTQTFLTAERWRDLHKKGSRVSIEHVAPQKSRGAGLTDPKIYEDKLEDTLGNLTLLYSPENIVLTNRPWDEKRAIYRVLASQTIEEFDEAVKSLDEAGVTLTVNGKDVLDGSSYAPMLRPLTNRDDDWNADFVRQRSQRLLGLAWDRLRPWLD